MRWSSGARSRAGLRRGWGGGLYNILYLLRFWRSDSRSVHKNPLIRWAHASLMSRRGRGRPRNPVVSKWDQRTRQTKFIAEKPLFVPLSKDIRTARGEMIRAMGGSSVANVPLVSGGFAGETGFYGRGQSGIKPSRCSTATSATGHHGRSRTANGVLWTPTVAIQQRDIMDARDG